MTTSGTDVVVVGSGAAGLAAALAAAGTGARVTLLESTDLIGGTTALSGGVAWVPGNHLQSPDTAPADVAAARTHLAHLRLGDVHDDLLDRFLVAGPDVMRTLEASSPLAWQPLVYPDYHADRPGASLGGRSIEPAPAAVPDSVLRRIRPAEWWIRATQQELVTGRASGPAHRRRVADGVVTMGRALVAGLLAGVLDAGVDVRTATPATGLVRDRDGTVNGVAVGRSVRGDLEEVPGRVVLATGGFERDDALVRAFLRIPRVACTGGPGARGDGLRMALAAGADLGTMSEAWWCPTVIVPTDDRHRPDAHLLLTERSLPGSIMVDATGRRFCNEAGNYNDVGRALHQFDPDGFRFDRDPAWLVVDEQFRTTTPIGPIRPDQPDAADWVTGTDADDLARRAGLPPTVFAATLATFNQHAGAGRDPVHGRGTSPYDRFVGDATAAHPNLRPLAGPLTAVPVRAGTLGTKGGPRTDAHGRVLRPDGSAIPGLFAAGNAAASPFGMLYPGAGGTIAQALVFGHLAGRTAASSP